MIDWFNQIWADLVVHIDEGCIGGVFFEYNDEPYTKADVLQQSMGVVAFEVSYDSYGNSSLQPNMWIPDKVVKKDLIFNAIKSGKHDGKEYNLNGNVFELLGRNQSKLSAEQCVHETTPTFSPYPGTSGTTYPKTTSASTTSTEPQQPSTTTSSSEIVDSSASHLYGYLFVLLLIFVNI